MRPIQNPPNPFESHVRDLLEPAPDARVTLFEDATRRILSRNESPDLPFRWSVNPYRGCFHACAYCYARPSHEYWGFGAGTDFESKLIVKPSAAALLREAFASRSWAGELVLFSGNTDCYQPIEASYGLTRQCLDVCAAFANPVAIITKGTLLLRDLDILRAIAARAWLRVYVSLPFAQQEMARKLEPHVPTPAKRLEMIRRLTDAGISVGVSLAPIIPGLNDSDIPLVLRQAREAGATEAFMTLLRLPGSGAAVFWERLAEAYPDRVDRVRHRLAQTQGAASRPSEFFDRQRGHDDGWRTIEQLFAVTCRRLGLASDGRHTVPQTFQRPLPQSAQITLF